MNKFGFKLCLSAFLLSFPSLVFAQWTDQPLKGTQVERYYVLSDKTIVLESNTVYVLLNGDVFHAEKCELLSGGRTGMPLSLAKKRGYKICPNCLQENIFYLNSSAGYEWNFSLQQPALSKGLQYSDDSVDVFFNITKTQIGFIFKNKTNSGIKINWDDLSFVSPIGRASRVIHSGVKLIDRNNSQASTTIPPNSVITDILIPSENISFKEKEWKEGLLFEGDPATYGEKEFSVFFPVEINRAKKEYSFKFKISITQLPAPKIK